MKLKKIICYNCEKEFEGSIYIQSPTPCPECRTKGFKSIIITKDKRIKCYNCNEIFNGPYNCQEKKTPCPDCKEKGFKLKSEIKKIKCYNCNKIFEAPFNASDEVTSCPDCKEKGFRNIGTIKKIKCYNCNEIFEETQYVSNLKSPCPECKEKGFKLKSEIKKIKCYNCNQIFEAHQSVSNLKSSCPECKEKGFKLNYTKEEYEQFNLKKIKTSLKNWNVDNPMKSKIIKEKVKQTSLKNWNVDNPSKSEEIKKKKEKTTLKNWNVKCSFQSEIIKEKCKQTYLEKTGVDNPSKLEEVKEKKKKTWLENWNVDNPSKSPEIREKIKQSMLENWNAEYYTQSKEYQIKVFENIKKSLKLLNIELADEEYQNQIFNHNWKCLKCNNIFQHSWQNMWRCKICYPRVGNSSIEELEIFEYIRCLNISNNIILNDTQKINPLELDIYIPEKNIAIEFDGLHWHSEEWQELCMNDNYPYTPQTYHLYKTNKCEELGIQLIHIFEDEWIFKQEIVKSRLKQIFGVSSNERIHARECIVKEISSQKKNEFLEKFHIQGPDSSSIKLGSFHGEDLVSIMTFSKGNISKGSKNIEGVWELNRFCSDSNFHIPGIAGKLLSYFKKNYNWNEIFSYADRRWSQGNLYDKLGFELVLVIQPNYWYTSGLKRIHRFSLRKRPDEPKDISERILRLNEGYGRIWDCGSLKFKLENSKEI